MAVCASCAPPASSVLPHNDGDHYGGIGSCSFCGPDICRAFTAAPAPEHDPRPIDAQFQEIREALEHIGPALRLRDEATAAAHSIADKASARLDVVERELREAIAHMTALRTV